MRHASPPGLPGCCGRCFLPELLCLCAAIPSIQTRTRFTIVRHANEDWKSTNTARLAALAMPQARLVSYGNRARSFRERRWIWMAPASSPTRAIRRLRQGRTPHAMSTLEAIAGAVSLLEGDEAGRALDALYVLFVERVLRTRGEA